MPVQSVIEDYKSSGPASTHVDLVTLRASKTDVRVFDVLFTPGETPSQRRVLALSAEDPHRSGEHYRIPQYWEQHPADPWMFVNNIHSEQSNGPHRYRVTVNYTSIGNPLELPMEIEWFHTVQNEPFDRDREGNAITNSAGESFDPTLTKDVYDLGLRIKRNEQLFNELVATKYIGAVNSDDFTVPVDLLGTTRVYRPGIVKCSLFKGVPKRAAGLFYHEVQREFLFRLGEIEETEPGVWETSGLGHKKRVLDQGFRVLKKESGIWTGEYEPILDKEGNPVREPQLLDGHGEQLKEEADPGEGLDKDGNPTNLNRFKGVFLVWDVDKKLPFNNLMLA